MNTSESVCSVFWNARSVRKNLEEILLELEAWKCNIHVLCLAETWLTPDTQSLFRIDGYKPFYQSRVQRGGGVAIFIRENYTAQPMDDVSYISESLECVFVRANNNVGSFVIGCLYRPLKSNIDDFLVKLEQILIYIRENCKNDKIVIPGDFNIDLLKLRENSFADRFLILMSSFGMMPVILRPTRFTVNSRSIIDKIFVSDTSMFRSSNVIKSKISDHFPIVSCFGNSDLGTRK